MLSYSKTAMERAVKVQEVISRAEAKRSRHGRQQKKWRARRGCGRLTKAGHFICYEKGDISNVVRMGTFLMSVDKFHSTSLTETAEGAQNPRQLK